MEKKSMNIADVRQKTHESVDNIMDKAESFSDTGKESIAQINEKASMIKGSVDDYIRKNPETSLLIAAGVGALVGGILAAAMMGRRR